MEEQLQRHGCDAGQKFLIGEKIVPLDAQLKHEFPDLFSGGRHMKGRSENNADGIVAENTVKLIIGGDEIAGLLIDLKQLPQVRSSWIHGKLDGVFDGNRFSVPVDADIHTGEVGNVLGDIGVIHIAPGFRSRRFRLRRICGFFRVFF